MKKICLCFQIHQPYRLRRYRFFDIGNEHYYIDDFQNEEIFDRIALECYLPANRLMLDLLKTYPEFHISYSLSGLVIEQMEYYKPEIIESFKELASTGRVEFLAETYAHSLTSLYDHTEWSAQIAMQQAKLRELFGIEPSSVLCNTELIYNDSIAQVAQQLGFKGIITEEARHVLGWQSPNYVYRSNTSGALNLLFRNSGLSELISKHFSDYGSHEYPITADKIINRIQWQAEDEKFCILLMNYETIGSIHKKESGIFDFFRALPRLAISGGIGFTTPRDIISSHKPKVKVAVNNPISISDEEKSTNIWTGNVLQQGVIDKLSVWGERVRTCQDRRLLQDWLYLQSADHLFYMNASKSKGFSPYTSAYDAFNNYMNVLSDFLLRVEEQAPSNFETEELNSYQKTIRNQNLRIEALEEEIRALKKPKKATPQKNKNKEV